MVPYKKEVFEFNIVTCFDTPMEPTWPVKRHDVTQAELSIQLDAYLKSHKWEKFKVPNLILMTGQTRTQTVFTEYKHTHDVIAKALFDIFECAREGRTFTYDEYVSTYVVSNKRMIHNVIQHFLISQYDMMLHLAQSKQAEDGSMEYRTLNIDKPYSDLFKLAQAEFLLTRNHTQLYQSNEMVELDRIEERTDPLIGLPF